MHEDRLRGRCYRAAMTPAKTSDAVDGAAMLAAAADFLAELRERSIEIDRLRQLPQDLADSLAEAGFYRTLVPPSLGGLGLSPVAVAQVSETLATGNASAAWCTFIGATSQIMFAALTPEQLAGILRNPDVITAGVFASSGRATPARGPDNADGYIVSGRWAWASGCHNAEWISGGVLIDHGDHVDSGVNSGVDRAANPTDTAKPADGRAFFRPEEIVVHDDWHTSGLAGLGLKHLRGTRCVAPRDPDREEFRHLAVAPRRRAAVSLPAVRFAGAADRRDRIGDGAGQHRRSHRRRQDQSAPRLATNAGAAPQPSHGGCSG